MLILRQHTWARNRNHIVPLAVGKDIDKLEEFAAGIPPTGTDELIVWGSMDDGIAYSTIWKFGGAEHYFSISKIREVI
jgi:hypothetical protein